MQIHYTLNKSAKEIMDKDEFFLNNLKNEPMLHFYEWKNDSLTYGYFIDIEKYIDLQKAKDKNLSIAKRPTGGGIVFHLWDLAFSFLMPSSNKNFFKSSFDNYKFVNSVTLNAVKDFLSEGFLFKKEFAAEKKMSYSNFCMAKPTKYDLIYKDKKIAGASQRKKKNGYLHQASICLTSPDFLYLKEILIEKDIAKKIILNSYPIFSKKFEIKQKTKIIIKNLIKSFKKQIS